jgi:hypothetical protein
MRRSTCRTSRPPPSEVIDPSAIELLCYFPRRWSFKLETNLAALWFQTFWLLLCLRQIEPILATGFVRNGG